MSDNEEYVKFEVTDYDLINEFNINRAGSKITKNQQIYGIWADDKDDDDLSPRVGFKGANRSAKQSYKVPIGFVAGGIQQAGLKNEDKEDDESDEEASTSAPSTSRGRRIRNSSSDDDSDERSTTSYRKYQTHYQESDTFIEHEIAGMRGPKTTRVNPALIEKGYGGWEKHTKGIGAKLLLQMGFQPGKGLGKDLQGISAPVEAHLRKGRGAIGAYGPEKGHKIGEVRKDADVEEAKEFVEKLSKWRKDVSEGQSKKIRYVYKSVDEVLEQGKGKVIRRDYSNLSKVKVIDMTGPQQRVLSGYHAISGQQQPSEEWEVRKDKKFSNFALPELQHNLNLLVDMCEQDIIDNDRKLKHSRDRIVSLEHEEVHLARLVYHEQTQIDKLEKVLEIINQMAAEGSNLTLDRAFDCFKELKEHHYEEFKMYEIADMASSMVAPIIRKELEDWKPLSAPKLPIPLFQKWKSILELDVTLSTAASSDPYNKLVWNALLPSIRFAVSVWNCRQCDSMIELIESWLPYVSPWIIENIEEQLILPKIQREVVEWDPVTDTVPIHAWIHPWLSLLGIRFDSLLYPVIRHKLSKALVNWHPSDGSAKLMLLPWRNVFSKGDMDVFLVKNILPKLQLVMQEMLINPHQQHLDQWNLVMEWEELMPVYSMASILEKCFFPKWLQVLTLWLNHNPNYDEVTNWYMGWKNMVSESLLQQPVVKEQFRKALNMMNRAVATPGPSTVQHPGAIETVGYLTNLEQSNGQPTRDKMKEERLEMLAEAVRTASQIPQGFKELIQKRCEERGILFVPIPNRYREGKVVYRCGNIQLYIDKNVIFVNENLTSWIPKSLDKMLEMAVR